MSGSIDLQFVRPSVVCFAFCPRRVIMLGCPLFLLNGRVTQAYPRIGASAVSWKVAVLVSSLEALYRVHLIGRFRLRLSCRTNFSL